MKVKVKDIIECNKEILMYDFVNRESIRSSKGIECTNGSIGR